jgi:virginiamycin A acetyltransferase
MSDKPDPAVIHPAPGFAVTYVKPTVTRSNIEVGGFTYHSGEDFESRATHRYEFYGDKLIIGKFCQIASGVTFVMNGANHKMDGASTFPFYISERWGQEKPPLSEMPIKATQSSAMTCGLDRTPPPGVHVGDGAIIGLNSSVGSDVAPYSIVAGNPADLVRKRFDDELIGLPSRFKWRDKSVEEIRALMPSLNAGGDEERVKRGIMERL